MNRHNRSAGGRTPQKSHSHENAEASAEETLKSTSVQIERKTFVFTLKENPRGRFLRITEDVGGRRDTIIVPATGLEEFRRVLDEMLQIRGENTPVQP